MPILSKYPLPQETHCVLPHERLSAGHYARHRSRAAWRF